MKKLILLITTVLLLAACTPSETTIQTAIAKTENAQPTGTFTPTLLPTSTPTSSPTSSPTPIPTPDARIIIGDAEDYILQKSDFPDKYVLLPGNSTPHLNSEILGARGIEEGKAYLEATGRIKGWLIWYYLDSPTAIAPEWVMSYIVMYQTAKGPELAMSPEWNNVYENFKLGEYELVEKNLDLGDENLVYFEREMQPSGEYYVWYYIDFRYRNVWAEVLGQGLESDVRPDYIEELARIVLRKLQEAPLSSP
jgi:hypothetical protein